VIVLPDRQNVTVYGKREPLPASMEVEAFVLLDERPLYQWILEPLYGLRHSYRGVKEYGAVTMGIARSCCTEEENADDASVRGRRMWNGLPSNDRGALRSPHGSGGAAQAVRPISQGHDPKRPYQLGFQAWARHSRAASGTATL